MKIDRKQQGMTLIETLVALSITGVVVGALAASIYTIMSITGRGNAEITVLQDIQSVSHWINNDARMASEVTLTGGIPANGIILDWDDSEGNPHSCNYTFTGRELIRNFEGTPSSIAWHVSSIEFSLNDDALTYTLISETEGRWGVNKEVTGCVNLRAWEEY